MSDLHTCNQVEFAKLLGCNKSHVTRLKQQGRLVMVGEGRGALVDVVASELRIAATEGGRDDVKARHDAEKGKARPPLDEKRIDAQTRLASAQADKAEMERDQLRGKLIERELVEAALADVVSFARQGFENLPHSIAAQLVGKDFDQIMATLKQEINSRFNEMHREAGKRLGELTETEV